MHEQSQIVLVTGASRGIGQACAMNLARSGWKVAFHYRNPEHASRLETLCADLPGARSFQADLTDPAQCEQLIKRVKEEMGGLHALVNNAGICIDQILAFAKPDDFDALIATNLKPVFVLSKHAAKAMLRQRWGRIVNITSVVGHTGNGGQSMYATTKAAITGFTRSIAQELAAAGILANCVAPGFIETDMTAKLTAEVREAILGKVPLKRLGTPDDVAGAVRFLLSPEAAYITGTTIHVNGGMYTGG